jgi:hypothetical protein
VQALGAEPDTGQPLEQFMGATRSASGVLWWAAERSTVSERKPGAGLGLGAGSQASELHR